MTERHPEPPTGWSRLAFRAPIHLYRWHLGFLLGGRFILLRHIGRTSGIERTAVVEVVRRTSDGFVICSGFGEQSQWYRNLMAHPAIRVQSGRRTLDVVAGRLSPAQGETEMLAYAAAHPRAARKLARFMGFESDETTDDAADGTAGSSTYREIGRTMPFVRLVESE